jgi:hypothetical protein
VLNQHSRKENLEKPAGHFCKSGHKASDMEVIAIERVKGDDVFRVEREKYGFREWTQSYRRIRSGRKNKWPGKLRRMVRKRNKKDQVK